MRRQAFRCRRCRRCPVGARAVRRAMLRTVADAESGWGRPWGVAALPGTAHGADAASGQLLVSDERAGAMRRLDLAPGGAAAGPAVEVASGLRGPQGVACGGDRLFVCESVRGRVAAVALAHGAAAESVLEGLVQPSGVAVADHMLYVASAGQHAVFAKDLRCSDAPVAIAGVPGVAGNMKHDPCGDGGDAREARLFSPYDVALGDAGEVYVVDSFNGRVREVRGGVIRTIAGADQARPRGGAGRAAEINIGQPRAVACGAGGFFVATTPAMVWQLQGGEMLPAVGTFVDGYNGDEGEASDVRLNVPCGLAFLGSALAVADSGNRRVCLVTWP